MPRYLISFDDGAMTFPEEDLPDVAKAALRVVHEAQDAGVWVFSAGLESQRASIVATDGRSPTARTRRPRRSSAGSRSSTWPPASRRRSGGQDRRRVPLCARSAGALPDPNV
jgi:hypothetical protein